MIMGKRSVYPQVHTIATTIPIGCNWEPVARSTPSGEPVHKNICCRCGEVPSWVLLLTYSSLPFTKKWGFRTPSPSPPPPSQVENSERAAHAHSDFGYDLSDGRPWGARL